MKKIILFLLCVINVFAQEEGVQGFWKSIDENSKKPQSIIAVYEYNGNYYGRIILTYDENGQVQDTLYNPKERAPGVKGNPPYAGMDIIWDLTRDDNNKYTDGHILDPEKGRVYGAELWNDANGDLVVRGKLLMFGRNQTWPRAVPTDFPPNFTPPDLSKFVPNIPQVNK